MVVVRPGPVACVRAPPIVDFVAARGPLSALRGKGTCRSPPGPGTLEAVARVVLGRAPWEVAIEGLFASEVGKICCADSE